MSLSLTEIIARRRLAGVYRRILVLAVPVALAGCQDGGDALAPDATDATAEVSAPVAEAPAVEDLVAAADLNRIAFSSYVAPGSADIWAMSPTGTNQQRLTSLSGSEIRPVWSPDHSRIAFGWARNGMPDIYLMNADGTNKHWARTTASANILAEASWSPDGTKLLVEKWTNNLSQVAKINTVTGALSLVAPAGAASLEGRFPIYSKDGKSIYYVDSKHFQIRRFVPGGDDMLVWAYSTVAVGDPALSPDGSKLAFFMNPNNNRDIYVLNLTTLAVKRMTTDSHDDTQPAWSPDGSKLAFTSNRSGKSQVYTMNSATGGNVVKITSKTYGADHPSWYR